jgi:hypothetical protein
VFIENKPGHLMTPCRLLAEAGINMVTLSLADSKDFGILRLIVRQWERARDVLERAGISVTVTEVLALEVVDRPGGLAELLVVFEKAGINVEYMYAFTGSVGNRGILVFRFDDLDAAISALCRAGINPVTPIDLYDHLEEE